MVEQEWSRTTRSLLTGNSRNGRASVSQTLRLVERPSRFGGAFVAIEDGFGLIEVADDMSAALARVAQCAEAA